MHIGQKIKELADKKKLTAQKIGDAIGVSKQAVYDIYQKEDVNTGILKQIAVLLGEPISVFFDDKSIEIKDNERSFNANADEVIKELTSIIKTQNERIKQLTDKLLGL